MLSKDDHESWDLSPVIDLLYSLSASSEVVQLREVEQPVTLIDDDRVPSLGNFDKIWTFLGQPLDVPPPQVIPLIRNGDHPLTEEFSNLDNDNGVKEVKWRDEVEGADLEDNTETDLEAGIAHLTKTQRKKIRRRRRQELEIQSQAHLQVPSSLIDNDSESDIQAAPMTPDRKAIIHSILYGSLPEPRAAKSPATNGHIVTGYEAWLSSPTILRRSSTKVANPIGKENLAVASAKKQKLMKMLHEKFVDERQFLDSISVVRHNGINDLAITEGIHVFVDSSNIMIGFHDALKLSWGLPIYSRIPRQSISFHNLSLVLERGRPTAKRVLVGSDNLAAVAEARSLGYEISILDRVHKAKELTPRQRRFRDGNNGTGTGTGTSGQSGGSGSETPGTASAKKWVEQAVDEILHLKILESVVDAKEPSTIILATGDAAEAEYSAGFLKMVQRALEKGWKVELCSFRHNTSGAYRKREFRSKWSGKFKIVELDDFVDVLCAE